MDANRFDDFTRILHESGWTRRHLTSIVTAGLLLGLPAVAGTETLAKGKKKKGKKNQPPPSPPASPPAQ